MTRRQSTHSAIYPGRCRSTPYKDTEHIEVSIPEGKCEDKTDFLILSWRSASSLRMCSPRRLKSLASWLSSVSSSTVAPSLSDKTDSFSSEGENPFSLAFSLAECLALAFVVLLKTLNIRHISFTPNEEAESLADIWSPNSFARVTSRRCSRSSSRVGYGKTFRRMRE
jgi:hypothetical protein